MDLLIEKIEKQENYQRNLRCLREAAQELLNHMKGYDLSFRPKITDKNGDFCAEKLRALVDEMLSLWAEKLREGRFIDPKTQKSEAEPYLEERQELYRLYLSLMMRCSLYPGAYSNARGGAGKKERTDFAFLLEQANWLSRCWCVTIGPKGRKNELMSGYDEHFGLHLYYPFHLYQTFLSDGLEYQYNDFALTPDWNMVWNRLGQLTNEGNMKRIYVRHLSSSPLPSPQEPGEAAPEEDGDAFLSYNTALWGYEDVRDADYWIAEAERLGEEESRRSAILNLVQNFEGLDEYLSDCEAFVKLFEGAKPEVLRDLYPELEEIVELYLSRQEAVPLADTDKTLDVYSRLFDGALRQAKRYARGLQWNDL